MGTRTFDVRVRDDVIQPATTAFIKLIDSGHTFTNSVRSTQDLYYLTRNELMIVVGCAALTFINPGAFDEDK